MAFSGLSIFISVYDIINIQMGKTLFPTYKSLLLIFTLNLMLRYLFSDEFNECLEHFKVYLKCLFEINPFLIQIKQGGVLLSSLLGPPDPTKTQVIQDPETGESKAKMTEVRVK